MWKKKSNDTLIAKMLIATAAEISSFLFYARTKYIIMKSFPTKTCSSMISKRNHSIYTTGLKNPAGIQSSTIHMGDLSQHIQYYVRETWTPRKLKEWWDNSLSCEVGDIWSLSVKWSTKSPWVDMSIRTKIYAKSIHPIQGLGASTRLILYIPLWESICSNSKTNVTIEKNRLCNSSSNLSSISKVIKQPGGLCTSLSAAKRTPLYSRNT